jgi:hypothetical protein
MKNCLLVYLNIMYNLFKSVLVTSTYGIYTIYSIT